MQIRRSIVGVIALWAGYPFLFPDMVQAVPRAVTFFPQSARLTDVVQIKPQTAGPEGFRVVIHLSAQALPDSLAVCLNADSRLRIEDQSWRQIQRQDEGRIADLRKSLQQTKTERIGVFSAIQALDARLRFWQAQDRAKTRTADETAGLAVQIGENVKRDTQEKLSLEPDLERLDKKIREIQEEITRVAGQKETVWELTLTLRGDAVGEEDLTLIYTLNGCGWQPLYRLDARPREGRILFDWEAEVWQGSGTDWDQIDTELATLQPHSALGPPELPPWIIRPRPELRLSRSRQNAEIAAAPMAVQAGTQDGEEPRETRQSTYAVWSLGKKTIPPGSRQRVKIREESWQADFVHLLRPSLTTQAFVRATVKLPEGREIPSGTAMFMIDGAVLGKRQFGFSGQDGVFSFGVDPLVTAQSVLLSRKSGEKGLIVDRQTQEWSWRMDIRNAGTSAVRIRLEEPMPQPRDERIHITLRSEPEASEKTSSEMVWRMEIPEGQKRTIFNTIRLDAPKEMDLDLGWRR